MLHHKLFILSMLTLLLFSCNKANDSNVHKYEKRVGVKYGPNDRNVLDLFLPKDRNTKDTKVFVWIHGGAWSDGDKSEFKHIQPFLDTTLNSYAFVSLNYRLFNANTNANRFPAQEEDIQLAMEFIYSKLSEWKVSENVVIAGASAGGHLALLQAFKHNQSGLIKAGIAYYPPTELVSYFPANLLSIAVLHGILNGNPNQRPEEYFQASPVNFITAESVPTLLFHGTADDVVPIQQSELLKEKLEEHNVPYDHIYFEGAGHAFSSQEAQETVRRIRDFLNLQGL